MSAAFEKFLEDSLKAYGDSLRRQGEHIAETIKNTYLKGADGFVTFLTRGTPPKREERKRKD
jgi:hypothetical protein